MKSEPSLTPLDSSMLAGYAHDPDSRDLTIQYKDGDGKPTSTWVYEDVGADKVHTMVNSQSPGRYFNDRIKGIHNGYKVK